HEGIIVTSPSRGNSRQYQCLSRVSGVVQSLMKMLSIRPLHQLPPVPDQEPDPDPQRDDHANGS
ncbi:hypothetical protein, partial [Paenirhodobacter populi]|uniref:hypothetical protein n=1 Tax=Paenirhodobacter populi TaxID=2306993 RepID=UPI0019D49DEC